MRYNDDIKISQEYIFSNELQKIAERITQHFPEYAQPGASVTTNLIRIVDAITDDDFNPKAIDPDDLADYELSYIISTLTDEQIAQPLGAKTIEIIMNAIFRCIDNHHLEANLFTECKDASDYSSRGHAKKQLGLYEEALQDYEKACALEPGNAAYFIYRAEIFHKLGVCEKAMQDALSAFDMTTDTLFDNPESLFDMVHLSLLFDDFKHSKMTALALLRYVEALNTFLPLFSIQEDGTFEIEKEDQLYSSDLCDFELYIAMIKGIEERAERDIELNMLLVRLKDEIALFRERVGF